MLLSRQASNVRWKTDGGSVFADFNNDGYLDLYITGWPNPNPLYLNNGDGTFSEVGVKAGVASIGGLDVAVADYDNDGGIDIYIPHDGSSLLYHNNNDSTFSEVSAKARVNFSGWGAVFFDYDNDGLLDLFVANDALAPDRSVLYHNEGNGTFKDVTKQAGVERIGQGLMSSIGDYDDDGYMDLFLGNLNQLGVLYHNKRDGTFTDVTKDLGVVLQPNEKMVFGDYDNDDNLDIRTFTRLYRNEGRGKFADVTNGSGLGTATAVSMFADFDNDGYLDILDRLGTSLVLYLNNGDGTFRDVTEEARLKRAPTGTFLSFPVGDYDNDGFLDIYTCYASPGGGIAGPNVLYRNNGNNNHWLHLRLVGTKSNRNAIGAKVRLTAGGMTQFREVGTGGHSYSQDTFDVEFGLGQAARADTIEIRWPSGEVSVLNGVPANQKIIVTEGQAGYKVAWRGNNFPVEPRGKLATTLGHVKGTVLYQNYPNPFNPETWIPYQLATDVDVTLVIYNLTGQIVRTMQLGRQPVGLYLNEERAAYWDGRNNRCEKVSSGIYFYRLQYGDELSTARKLAVDK